MDKNVLKKEQEKLDETVTLLKEKRSSLKKSLDDLGKETISKLEELRQSPESNVMDFFMFLEQIHGEHEAFNLKDRYKRLEEMDYSIREPYFARIDLRKKNEGTSKKLYIGKFGFSHNMRPVITDWRSKIASVYYRYRYPQENVTYDTQEGKKKRDLLLKRTYDIQDSELIKYYNNDLQLDENEIIAEKIESRTGGVLEDIVQTIQESQLDIIEEDPRNPVVVQGCVGSGKSTVAIHKLSHVFFNYPDLILPERTILIAKKQILVSYLATLFPKLGIFDINYKTLKDLVYNFIFREELKITPDFSLSERKDLLTLDTLGKVRKEIKDIERKYEDLLQKIFGGEYESFGGYTYDHELTPYENFSFIIDDLSEELSAQQERLKINPRAARAWLYKTNIESLKKILTSLRRHKNNLIGDLEKISSKFNISYEGKIDYAGSLVYVFLHNKIIGADKDKVIKYQYCVVDEGQDFSPMEFAVMGTFVLHKRMCVMGDLNQKVLPEGLPSWKYLEKILPGKSFKHFELDTNYRSTRQIVNYANSILQPFTNKYLPESINRKGPHPVEIKMKNKKELLEHFEKSFEDDIKNYSKSIGIIAYKTDYLEDLRSILKKSTVKQDRITVLEKGKNIEYKPKGIYLTEFENCKGLEFGKVYLIGRNPLDNETFEEARASFIGVTRAMDELQIYYKS